MLINIRGTNGSGKTTLARSFQEGGSIVHLTSYQKQLKHGFKNKEVTGVVNTIPVIGRVICVGSYAQAQGGLDTIPSFDLQMEAVRMALGKAEHVICEGILASTVAGSWLKFFRELADRGTHTLVGYLDTPVEVCLERIRGRQERAGKVRDIKEELVRDKVKAIEATRDKFTRAGIDTVTLHHGEAEVQLHRILTGDA